jgi:GGDEF domain-containing protein
LSAARTAANCRSTFRYQTAELQKLHAALKELANRDSLTGLLNRRAFQEHATQVLRTARRRKESTALLMTDLDHFKAVNDRYGHAEGDHALKMVATALKATARENDMVARLGGEEFVVAVLSANEHLCAPNAETRGFPDSGGIAHAGRRALYAAKHNGRNQVCHAHGLAQADFLP